MEIKFLFKVLLWHYLLEFYSYILFLSIVKYFDNENGG